VFETIQKQEDQDTAKKTEVGGRKREVGGFLLKLLGTFIDFN